MNICVTVNSKYMRYLYIMLGSLYEHHTKGEIHMYVIQRDFSDEDKKEIIAYSNKYDNKVDFIFADERKFLDFPFYKGGRNDLSLEIYLRLLIPEYLPQTIDRVLMLDVDLIINQNLHELYDLNFDEKLLAAAPNMCHNFNVPIEWRGWYGESRTNWTHYNTGVLLWNLNSIRKKYPKEYIFKQAWNLNIQTSTFEEEMFNVLFGEEDIVPLDPLRWNYISTNYMRVHKNPQYNMYSDEKCMLENCGIIHYAGLNPWQAGWKDFSYNIWWEYAKKTKFYEEILWETYIKAEEYLAKSKLENRKQQSELYKTKDFSKQILYYIDLITDDYGKQRFYANLEQRNIKKVLLYGVGKIAKVLYSVCTDDSIEIAGFLDSYYKGLFYGKSMINIDELEAIDENIDAIIVTVPYYYEEVTLLLKNKTKLPIINISMLL